MEDYRLKEEEDKKPRLGRVALAVLYTAAAYVPQITGQLPSSKAEAGMVMPSSALVRILDDNVDYAQAKKSGHRATFPSEYKEYYGKLLNDKRWQVAQPRGRDHEELVQYHHKRYNGTLPWQKDDERTDSDRLDDGWNRILPYLPLIAKECKKRRVPFELAVPLALAESNWRENAHSRDGALGPWQFMKPAARDMGLKNLGKNNDQRRDPVESTKAAIKYLGSIYNYIGFVEKSANISLSESEKWNWVAKAYNRGMGRIRGDFNHPMVKGKVSNYPDYADRYKGRRLECKNYLGKIYGIRRALIDRIKGDKQAFVHKDKNGKTKIDADKLYSKFLSLKKELDQGEKIDPHKLLEILQESLRGYKNDLKRKVHSRDWDIGAINQIEEDMAGIKRDYASAFRTKIKEKGKRVGIEEIVTNVGVDENNGDMTAQISKNGESYKVGIVSKKILPGDFLNKIADWLGGDPNNKNTVKELILRLNPEIKDADHLKRGDEIMVPGEYVEVPEVWLKTLTDKYYPFYSFQEARKKLYWLNGKNPSNDKMRPGDIILVPEMGRILKELR
ncbi:transglycosylase SLT domain-containing protein [Nanoarchaeota archaeon]